MTVAEVRRIRRLFYGLYVVALLGTMVMFRLGRLSGTDVRLLIGWGTLAALDICGTWFMRGNVNLAPIYSVEKGFTGFSFMLIAVLGLGGYSAAYPWLGWIWIAVLYISKVIALEYILKKGVVIQRQYVRTEHGPEEVPDAETMDQWMDTVAGWWRHGYGSEKRREVAKDALGTPANEVWVREAREERDRAMMDEVEALELEDHRG